MRLFRQEIGINQKKSKERLIGTRFVQTLLVCTLLFCLFLGFGGCFLGSDAIGMWHNVQVVDKDVRI